MIFVKSYSYLFWSAIQVYCVCFGDGLVCLTIKVRFKSAQTKQTENYWKLNEKPHEKMKNPIFEELHTVQATILSK